jgi:hypothetical protein
MPGYGLFGRIGATGNTATFAGISRLGSVGRFPSVALVRQNVVDATAPPTRVLWRPYEL